MMSINDRNIKRTYKIDDMKLADLIIELKKAETWVLGSSKMLLRTMQFIDFIRQLEILHAEVAYMKSVEQRIKDLTND